MYRAQKPEEVDWRAKRAGQLVFFVFSRSLGVRAYARAVKKIRINDIGILRLNLIFYKSRLKIGSVFASILWRFDRSRFEGCL